MILALLLVRASTFLRLPIGMDAVTRTIFGAFVRILGSEPHKSTFPPDPARSQGRENLRTRGSRKLEDVKIVQQSKRTIVGLDSLFASLLVAKNKVDPFM